MFVKPSQAIQRTGERVILLQNALDVAQTNLETAEHVAIRGERVAKISLIVMAGTAVVVTVAVVVGVTVGGTVHLVHRRRNRKEVEAIIDASSNSADL